MDKTDEAERNNPIEMFHFISPCFFQESKIDLSKAEEGQKKGVMGNRDKPLSWSNSNSSLLLFNSFLPSEKR